MLTTFNITQQGAYHIKKDMPCQDYSKTMRIHPDRLDGDLVITAVSDGVGSCLFSQDGSREAVEKAVQYISDGLAAEDAALSDECILSLLKDAFDCSYDAVLNYAEEHEYPFAQLDCTLTVSVYDGTTVWFGHIGDDGIVALYTDGTYEMITKRHKGEFASSVCPLRETSRWQFGKTEKPAASFALMTDGVLDYLVGTEFYDNRVFYPFIQPILADPMDSDEKMEVLKQEFEEYLSDDPEHPSGYREKVTDDISLAVVQNSEAVKNLPEISFDMDEWDRKTAEYKAKAFERLYEDRKKAAAKKGVKPIVIEMEEDSSETDGLDVLQTKPPIQNTDHQEETLPAKTDDSAAEIQEAAEQFLSDVVETGKDAGKGLFKIGKSMKQLGEAIYSSFKDKNKE